MSVKDTLEQIVNSMLYPLKAINDNFATLATPFKTIDAENKTVELEEGWTLSADNLEVNGTRIQLSDTGWVDATKGASVTGTAKYRVLNGTTEIQLEVQGSGGFGPTYPIATLPVGARPAVYRRDVLPYGGGIVLVTTNPSGVVYLSGNLGTEYAKTNQVTGSITYTAAAT